MERDWRDVAREDAQDLASELGSVRRLTDAEVRELTPGYPWPRLGQASGLVQVTA
jgi:hypothetical protein